VGLPVKAGTRGQRVLVPASKCPARIGPDARLVSPNLLRRRDRADESSSGARTRSSGACHAGSTQRFAPGARCAPAQAGITSRRLPNLLRGDGDAGQRQHRRHLVFLLPDFGVQGVLDRFSQIEPWVLFAADGCGTTARPSTRWQRSPKCAGCPRWHAWWWRPRRRWRGRVRRAERRAHGRFFALRRARHRVRAIAVRTPALHHVFVGHHRCARALCTAPALLLQHLKEHQLHSDVKPGDRLFYFTTCG
jgi:acetoacetyl-CoA synthetase